MVAIAAGRGKFSDFASDLGERSRQSWQIDVEDHGVVARPKFSAARRGGEQGRCARC
jgi:hypothetical protein